MLLVEYIDRSNLIIFLMGQLTMFVLWLVRMDSTGTKAGKIMLIEVNRRFEQLEDRLLGLEKRVNEMWNRKPK